MARELQPGGVYVAHAIIDGPTARGSLRSILPDQSPFLQPDDIAEAYYQLHVPRRGAWGDADVGFRESELLQFQQLFPAAGLSSLERHFDVNFE
jgi:hypothetical protein